MSRKTLGSYSFVGIESRVASRSKHRREPWQRQDQVRPVGRRASNGTVLTLPALQQRLRLRPLRHRQAELTPEARRVVPVQQVRDLVGGDVLHGDLRRLDEAPVDADDVVLAAGAPGVLRVGDASAGGLYPELAFMRSDEAFKVTQRALS